VHPGDLAGGFSDLEMTWLLYCAGAATASAMIHNSTNVTVSAGTLASTYKRFNCVSIV